MSTADILSAVQKYPDIGTDNSAYVSQLITLVQARIVDYCNMEEWPEADTQGYSESAAGAGTDLTALSENTLLLEIDNSGVVEVSVTLAGCTDGSATAAQLQADIRAALAAGATGYRSFKYAAVTWGTTYKIASPTFGRDSRVRVHSDDTYFEVAYAAKLGADFGGTEHRGFMRNERLEAAAAEIAAQAYRWYRMVPQTYKDVPDEAVQRVFRQLSPNAKASLDAAKNWGV